MMILNKELLITHGRDFLTFIEIIIPFILSVTGMMTMYVSLLPFFPIDPNKKPSRETIIKAVTLCLVGLSIFLVGWDSYTTIIENWAWEGYDRDEF